MTRFAGKGTLSVCLEEGQLHLKCCSSRQLPLHLSIPDTKWRLLASTSIVSIKAATSASESCSP